MNTTDTVRKVNRGKLAELTSVTGATIAGVAVGAWLAEILRTKIPIILLIGILLHGWGMYDRRRLEISASGLQPRWVTGLYWFCWIVLAALIGWVVLRSR